MPDIEGSAGPATSDRRLLAVLAADAGPHERGQLRYLHLEDRVVMVGDHRVADPDEQPDGHARMLAGVGDAGGDARLEVGERGGRLAVLAGDLQRDAIGDARAVTS